MTSIPLCCCCPKRAFRHAAKGLDSQSAIGRATLRDCWALKPAAQMTDTPIIYGTTAPDRAL
jgi:hypothetical protein